MLSSEIIINNLYKKLAARQPLSIEETGRRILFTAFLLLIIAGLAAFGTVNFRKGLISYAVADFILILIFLSLLTLVRYLKNGLPVYRTGVIIFTAVLFYWIYTGAIQGYSSIWSLIFPLFTFFLLGKKEGFIWTTFYFIVISVLFFIPGTAMTGFTDPIQFVSRYLFLYSMIFLVAYNYESVREKYKTAMEAEQEKLILEKQKLATAMKETEKANRLLTLEISVREKAESELWGHHHSLEDLIAERTLEIKKNNDELQASEKRYRMMSDNVDDMIWSTDMHLNFNFISPSVQRLYGYTVEEALQLTIDRWSTPESQKKVIETYKSQIENEKKEDRNSDRFVVLQLDQLKKDGTVFPAELKISFIRDENRNAVGIVGITRDISERIASEKEKEKIKEQLVQSQKMEALGTLVGGLAHDFNNFLTGITGSFDLLSLALGKENLNRKDYVDKYIRLGMESSKRSAGLINQLLILSKKHEIKLTPVDINTSISHIYELCRNSLPKSVELNFSTDDSPLVIMGDMVQIEQILLNLCINASHAMTIMRPAGIKHGGTLTVSAEKIDSDYIMKENYNDTSGIVKNWVRIVISDTGVGIDNETRKRIFEPFFSTKNKNESSGLGLAITYNIIKKHGGIINVHSEQGKGSAFSVYFPLYQEVSVICDEDNRPEIVCGSGTILIIDDEPAILSIAGGFLEQCGYDVITAEGADMGIETFRKVHERLSAVLIDLSMPGKSGLEVFHELKKTDKNVKAILSSGMMDNELKESALIAGVRETVNKPYMAAELSARVSEVINGR